MSSNNPFSFLHSEGQFSNLDYEFLKNEPRRLIPILLSKKNSVKFLDLMEKASLFHPKAKSLKSKPQLEDLSKQPLTEVIT